MNNGASRPPAVTGSITSDNKGMPTMENPPPNAPFMKQIRKTPPKAIRIVVVVSSMASPPCCESNATPHGAGDCSQSLPYISVQSVQFNRCTQHAPKLTSSAALLHLA